MLDYKDIITKHDALGMSGAKIAESLKVSKSGVNDFLRPLRVGISATRCRTTRPWRRT